ncbi:MAG: RtcB family protein [Candidatus Woesearchaeota archaeon]
MVENKKLKQIGPVLWELSTDFKEGMRVPARIYASEKLLKDMDEAVFQQISNVACLPGIQKHALCMPDGHSGYGFPIGGVAAFDLDEGIISPGGIGFDVNCLTPGSKILSEHGFFKPIKDFEESFVDIEIAHDEYALKSMKSMQSVVSFSIPEKCFSPKQALFFMKKKNHGKIFQIKTKLGYSISLTGEHPILTKNGMVKAGELSKEDFLAVHPFEGVEYKEPADIQLVDGSAFTRQERAELEKRGLLPLSLRHPKMPIIAKLFGYLLGDGSIYFSAKKGFVNAYGSEEDLVEIQGDLAKLGFSAKIYSRERDHNIPTKYGVVSFSNKTFELHTPSRALAKLFFYLEYPRGSKTVANFSVPSWIQKSPLWIKRLFLAGFFGAELSTPKTTSKTCFGCPTVSINKNRSAIDSGREFAIQIMNLLEEFGIDTLKLLQREDYHNKQGPTDRLRLFINSEENNLLKLWSNVGFCYNRKRHVLSQIGILYLKEKKFLTQKRKDAAIKIKDLKKKGLTIREIQKIMESPSVNKRFIIRHFYEKAGQRITLDFPSFDSYICLKKTDLEKYGCFFDAIISISEEECNDYVYDFNVDKTHTFIADNVIVSNCGIRLLTTNLTADEVRPKIKELTKLLFRNVPAGVGLKGTVPVSSSEFQNVVESGAKWCVEKGFAWEKDIKHIENNGSIQPADVSKLSKKAISRGISQIGSLGSGNHFLEIQVVKKNSTFDEKLAEKFGFRGENQVVFMIHTGSRGFGHQIGTDYLKKFTDIMPKYNIKVNDHELACAPFNSDEGQDYYRAMACAANNAFVNRQVITHRAREAFSKVFSRTPEEMEINLVYDVAHNIAKIEKHDIDGKIRKLIVHRKGATRCFGPSSDEIPEDYKGLGQPIVLGGSMETGGYLLLGTDKAHKETFASTAHGSGRSMSRSKAKSLVNGKELQQSMEARGIFVETASLPGLAEEAGIAYKDVSEVVQTMDTAGISRKIVKMFPMGNIKG